MSTTSPKLPEDLKQLALAAARQQGVSPHAFMVDAIRSAAVAAEKRASFVADALAAQAETLESGQAYTADAVHTYARARARGELVARPEAESWRK
ncbi:hypothetical protein IAI53_12435 [Thauera sp. CAU 1555]|uniref:CopG family transcriptional regulator n=1 Tax=Thauera sedimentorum TaxID=2767595 RepID=A0ABR9BBH3_9RHOO|nr:hypothetical protein [Thauera sedimentorum]MBC9072776.1 hypothetical protein [Thauera sedimentorum]MBD8503695.1 hypothetical protein [Thauera sedimentorum]